MCKRIIYGNTVGASAPVVGKRSNDYGETFNVYKDDYVDDISLIPNKAISVASHAEGNGTIAGVKVFLIQNSRNIELDAPIDETVENSNIIGVYALDSVSGIEVGDEFSIKYASNYDFRRTVIAIGPTDGLEFELADNEIATYGSVVVEDNYDVEYYGLGKLYLPYKPTIGTTSWGTGQHSEGDSTRAVGTQAHAEGYGTVAAGGYSHAEGVSTVAAYAAHAEGNKTQAIGNQSHAGGTKSIAKGENSFAHGSACEAGGVCSFATGKGTKSTASTQFVVGSYNDIRDDAALIIGNGSKDSSRSNAFVVTKDGSGELSKQGTSDNSVVIRNTLNKVVEYCGIQEIKTADNVLVVDPTISVSEECLISASNSGEIKKFGTNLLKTNKTYNAYGIVTILDPSEPSGIIINGTAERKLTEVQAAYYSMYLPAGHYTFFIEGLDSKHSSANVYFRLCGITAAGEESELASVNSINTEAEFDILETVGEIKIKTVIQTGESFVDEHIRFQLQAGSKTDFVPYKQFTTIKMEAGEETVIQIDDLTPFTLIAQTEGNTITCKYPVSTKSYIDKNRAKTFTVTVPTSWTYNIGVGYKQTVAVEGISANDDPIVDVLLGDDISQNSKQLEAWECITRITTADNSITLYANVNRPGSAFTIRLKAV